MSNIAQINKKLNFNHECDNTLDACGVDKFLLKRKMDLISKKLNENQNDGIKMSVIVELVEKTFTKRELAFMHVNDVLKQNFTGSIGSIDELIKILKD